MLEDVLNRYFTYVFYTYLFLFFLNSLAEFRWIFLKMCCQLSLSKTNLSRHQTPHELLPKLFGPLRERYAERQGGYTRVLRVEPKKDDQAPSAILELVDGPKDMRFAITAKAIARQREQGIQTLNELTALNVRKVTRYRKDGVEALEKEIEKMTLEADKKKNKKNQEKEGAEDEDEGRRGK
jgi:large subunit ribosomal protein L17